MKPLSKKKRRGRHCRGGGEEEEEGKLEKTRSHGGEGGLNTKPQ